jgi:hypothetical protein
MRLEHEYFREGPGPIWQPGTSIAPNYSAGVKEKWDRPHRPPHSRGYDPRALPVRSPRLLGHGQLLGSSRSQGRTTHSLAMALMPSWRTPPSTPVGSTKSKSIFPSSRKRCLLPMTSYPWPSWSTGYWTSKSIISELLPRFSGPPLQGSQRLIN